MSVDLVLRPSCDQCGSSSELYGSNCKHLTLCLACGKAMAENRAKCNVCFVAVSRLIREYNVLASASTDKALCIGRFITGLPPFSKKKSSGSKWILYQEGIHGCQLAGSLRERRKSKTLVLEDESGQHQYQGQQLEGAHAAKYYLLTMHGKEFVAVPACSWYNFNKIAQYKQLTLDEAEEKMNRRRNNATEYERWMMKAAISGMTAFGETKRDEVFSNDHDETYSGNGEEDVEQEETWKNRHAHVKKNIHNEEEVKESSIQSDLDDEDNEKGDDWEHDETFSDDDEAVGYNIEERDDLAPELPALPEIKQDYEDEGGNGGLSKSGKGLKKLLGRVAGLNLSDDEDEDDQVPKSSKAKRRQGCDYKKSPHGAPVKKLKTDDESRLSSIKDEHSSSTKSNLVPKSSTLIPSRTGISPSVDAVTEDEMRDVLSSLALLTTQDLVA